MDEQTPRSKSPKLTNSFPEGIPGDEIPDSHQIASDEIPRNPGHPSNRLANSLTKAGAEPPLGSRILGLK